MRARAWAWWLGLLGAVAGARELDPGACAARFDVQRDKIIRTEESREMGARYLSELDVGARAECLRLCCETDSCDVFVYEEKGPGSCYLFNCGPPEDFRCKFTAHGNFSSGVLALSRHLAELQDQEQRALHEQELANLRSATSTTPRTSTTTSTPPAPPTPPPPAPPHHPPPGRCSRYQFECRRGGECIAVYNACDGVPQCADGSDEAPELGCPPPPPPPAAPPTTPRHQSSFKPLQESGEGGSSAGGDGEPAAALSESAAAPAPALGVRWPHRLMQAQPQHRFGAESGSGGSHIFSHKGGLLQEAEGVAYAPFEPPAPWSRHSWPQQQPGVDAMGAVGGASAWGGGGYARDWDRAWPVPPRADPVPEMPVYIPAKTMPEVPVVYSSVQQTLRDSAKKGPEAARQDAAAAGAREPAPPPPPPPPAARPPPPPPPDLREERRPDTKPHTPDIKINKEKAAAGAAAARRQPGAADADGLSERPPAAVLLLVLGVLLTAAMGGMLGWRARAARRRLRRGKPFAHDADYLVNGMYL